MFCVGFLSFHIKKIVFILLILLLVMKVEHFSSDDLEAFFFSKKCNTRLSHENKIKEEFLSFKNVDIVKKKLDIYLKII